MLVLTADELHSRFFHDASADPKTDRLRRRGTRAPACPNTTPGVSSRGAELVGGHETACLEPCRRCALVKVWFRRDGPFIRFARLAVRRGSS